MHLLYLAPIFKIPHSFTESTLAGLLCFWFGHADILHANTLINHCIICHTMTLHSSCLNSIITIHRTLWICTYTFQDDFYPVSLTFVQFDFIHLYIHMSPLHLSTSLGFFSMLHLLSLIFCPWALKQITCLLLSPSPQSLEHYEKIKMIRCNFHVGTHLTVLPFMPVIVAKVVIANFS